MCVNCVTPEKVHFKVILVIIMVKIVIVMIMMMMLTMMVMVPNMMMMTTCNIALGCLCKHLSHNPPCHSCNRYNDNHKQLCSQNNYNYDDIHLG